MWANAWDVFRRALSRGGRGRRVAVDVVVCFGWGGFFRVFFSIFFFFERTRPAASTRPPLASFTFLLEMRQSRGSEEAVFCLWAKKPLHTGVRTGCHYLFCLSVCVCVCNIRRFY